VSRPYDARMTETRIGLLGAGNMAEALIGGWLAAGLRAPNALSASDVRPERLEDLRRRYGIDTSPSNATLVERAEVIVLSVKPQAAASVLTDISEALSERHLLISIAAGLSVAAIEASIPHGVRVVRTMPNTPALVRAGATAIAAGTHARAEDLELTAKLFDAVGTTVVVPEGLLDAVTGLSGSGPAYVMVFLEALADGGVRMGLPRDVARQLAIQTVLGSVKLLLETGEHPAVLKDRVASPAGTTIAGLAALERAGLRSALIEAIAAATLRSTELGRR
jgi:pyrroline-5-carboxylate reductase